ncbi:unnamed protein product [Dicrocoelium dendriticum]|nr:unnamed protein product [Dicrocoelium dendriticum]
MPINSSSNVAPSSDIDKHQLLPDAQQSLSCSSNSRSSLSPFGCLPTGVTGFSSANSSAMSAAAAAAFLLQAATAGSANGDNAQGSSMPVRRSSTASFFESPQVSPTFSSAVISAAAQQAALAAAHAIGSSNSSPSVKTSSDLQAAVISLALAANPSSSNQSDIYRCDTQDHAIRPSQAMTDFLLLSERHPELLTAHPALKSVFRRRSSAVLSSYLSDLPTNETISDHASLGSESNMSQNILSALELMNTRRPLLSDPSTPSNFPPNCGSQETYATDRGSHKDHSTREVDHYRLTSSACVPEQQPPKCTHQYPSSELPLAGSALTCDRHLSRTYKGSPHFEAHASSFSLHPSARSNSTNRCVASPTVASSLNDGSSVICHSTSPLSYSSLSNSATPGLNISPVPTDSRPLDIPMETQSDSGTNPSRLRHSQRGECLGFQEIKSEFSMGGSYSDDPNRKREQRLIKNREAARECRRKKKEYVKCLEARVSLLESQNQRLAEELRHVKALCFKELCGLGLSPSTAACAAAAAALAAATVPGTYSTPTTSATASLKSTYTDLGMRLAEHPFDESAVNLEHDHSASHSAHASRGRSRRRSIVSASKLPDLADITSPDATPHSHYNTVFATKPDYAGPPLHPFPLGAKKNKQNGPQAPTNVAIVSLSDTVHPRISPPYQSMSIHGDVYPPSATEMGRTHPAVGLSPFHNTPPDTSSCPPNQSPSYFLHPHATKRTYRNLSVNPREEHLFTHADDVDSDLDPPKSSRAADTVPSAAPSMLATVAAKVVEPDSSKQDCQLPV